jgi:hypothetical protein
VGPSTTINAASDSATSNLYPVMVSATGSNETAKASPSALSINANTQTIQANNGYFGGNLRVSGNLTVSGTTTTIESLRSTFVDPIIYLGQAIIENITDAVGNGSVVVYTANNSLIPGLKVSVAGITPSAYNIGFVLNKEIAAANSTTFSINHTGTGSYVSGGDILNPQQNLMLGSQ